MDVDFSALDDLAGTLADLGDVKSAGTDPAKVRTPGVWVELTGIALDDTYAPGAYTLEATLRLVVADADDRHAQAALATLLSAVTTVIDPVPGGVVRPVGVVLPGSDTILPGLSVPIALTVTQETP